MDGEDPSIPALVPNQRSFFSLTPSPLFTRAYKPGQTLALPGLRSKFASMPIKTKNHPPSFSASIVETMFAWTTAVSLFDIQASKAGDT